MDCIINNIGLIIILALIHFLTGFYSFVYWWTKDHDFTTDDIWFALLFGSLFGPLSFIVGWSIHGKKTIIKKKKIIIKKEG